MAEPAPQQESPKGRQVDLNRVVRRLTEQAGEQSQQVAMLGALVEQQDEALVQQQQLIDQLRAELVQATGGTDQEPAADAEPGDQPAPGRAASRRR